ncbi:Glutathione S-transferase [Tieghemiomyces parasiticus]|uniref:Glutathione S-transferase n=1 Tax=Tieghemiomyces parasiticus TaxID=78921 RepID=A0A9W8DJ10_9FUNG|nr:Glutathione S-transferase [Tieghemiomyces parasiticus]
MTPTYELIYVPFSGFGEISRAMLDYAGADWKAIDLPLAEATKLSPYGRVPVLRVNKPDGTVFTVSESRAIERYLAKQFGLYGSSDEEAALIDAYVSQWDDVRKYLFAYMHSSEAIKEEAAARLDKELAHLSEKHSSILTANTTEQGTHYVGNKVTWADISAYLDLELLNHPMVTKGKAEAIRAISQKFEPLTQTVVKDPKFVHYLKESKARRESYPR